MIPRALRMLSLHMGHVQCSLSQGSTHILWKTCLEQTQVGRVKDRGGETEGEVRDRAWRQREREGEVAEGERERVNAGGGQEEEYGRGVREKMGREG